MFFGFGYPFFWGFPFYGYRPWGYRPHYRRYWGRW